jgi:hypothetical protein
MNKKRRVKALYLHQALMLPGTSMNGITSITPEKNGKVILEHNYEANIIEFYENAQEGFIPITNVACGVYKPDLKSAADLK